MESDIPLTDVHLERQLASEGAIDQGLGQGSPTEADHRREFSLPRADAGKDAWAFLAGCFFIEALIWGKQNCIHFLHNWIQLISASVSSSKVFPFPSVSFKNIIEVMIHSHPSLPESLPLALHPQ